MSPDAESDTESALNVDEADDDDDDADDDDDDDVISYTARVFLGDIIHARGPEASACLTRSGQRPTPKPLSYAMLCSAHCVLHAC